MDLKQLFTQHPTSLNETYLEHLKFAEKCGIRMILGGAALLIHGLFPFIFAKTGSSTVDSVTNAMITRNKTATNSSEI
jgi:hypothetical protein